MPARKALVDAGWRKLSKLFGCGHVEQLLGCLANTHGCDVTDQWFLTGAGASQGERRYISRGARALARWI